MLVVNMLNRYQLTVRKETQDERMMILVLDFETCGAILDVQFQSYYHSWPESFHCFCIYE